MSFAIVGYIALGLALILLAWRRSVDIVGLGDSRDRALEALGAGLVVIDARGRATTCNAEARTLLGLGPDPSSPFLEIAAIRAVPGLASLLVAGEGGTEIEVGEGSARRKIEARAFVSRRGGRGRVLVLRDVTQSAALLEELTALASQDALTGAYNRRHFDELGGRDIELARRSLSEIGVLMLDIDFFKRVNDDFGHAAGDAVLKDLCATCKDALRSSDVLARYGGEEFAVLLPGSGPEESEMVADRLRERISKMATPYGEGECGRVVPVTVSIGAYAAVPEPGQDLALFLRRADEALYRAKALGRNRVCGWEPIKQGGGSC
jgi:diguanylate cyclase (GGDEF)-like protein